MTAAIFCALLTLIFFVILSNDIKTPEKSLFELKEGNKRFIADNLTHCTFNMTERRESTKDKQSPFAIILGCSDARVPPELIFDQHLGDLFIVRIAGNVPGTLVKESIQYSVLVNQSSLIVVMGHQNCGAVQAVIQNQTQSVAEIAKLIELSKERAKHLQGSPVEVLVKANVLETVKHLKQIPVFIDLQKDNKLLIVGAYYHFTNGEVEWLE